LLQKNIQQAKIVTKLNETMGLGNAQIQNLISPFQAPVTSAMGAN
jgi:hypothetical protein